MAGRQLPGIPGGTWGSPRRQQSAQRMQQRERARDRAGLRTVKQQRRPKVQESTSGRWLHVSCCACPTYRTQRASVYNADLERRWEDKQDQYGSMRPTKPSLLVSNVPTQTIPGFWPIPGCRPGAGPSSSRRRSSRPLLRELSLPGRPGRHWCHQKMPALACRTYLASISTNNQF